MSSIITMVTERKKLCLIFAFGAFFIDLCLLFLFERVVSYGLLGVYIALLFCMPTARILWGVLFLYYLELFIFYGDTGGIVIFLMILTGLAHTLQYFMSMAWVRQGIIGSAYLVVHYGYMEWYHAEYNISYSHIGETLLTTGAIMMTALWVSRQKIKNNMKFFTKNINKTHDI